MKYKLNIMKEKIKKVCLICKKEFKVSPSRSDRKFCSNKCRGIYRSKNNIGENNSNWKEKIKKVCLICSTEFEVISSRKDIAKYCSQKCVGIYQSENYSGENNSNWKEKIKKVCLICSTEFEVIPSHSYRKFCSKKCGGNI